MQATELLAKIEQIEKLLPPGKDWTNYICQSFFITTIQFVRNYIGKDTEFYLNLDHAYQEKRANAEAKRA